jgi:hypothetical protein
VEAPRPRLCAGPIVKVASRRDREIDHHACRRIAVTTWCPPADDPVAGVMALAAVRRRRGPTAEDLAQVHVSSASFA